MVYARGGVKGLRQVTKNSMRTIIGPTKLIDRKPIHKMRVLSDVGILR